jgi:hypothetical protein
MSAPYREHIHSGQDLITSYQAVRGGFVSLALEKNRRATPYVAQARALKQVASTVRSPNELLALTEIRPGLVTAAGVSDKGCTHLEEADKTAAIEGLIEEFLEPAGADFVEELVFRFLLTRGDTLGGSIRNIGGFMAQCKLTRAILAYLRLSGGSYQWLHGDTRQWHPMPATDETVESSARALSWRIGEKWRSLVYNLTSPIIRNNVDLCLFNCSSDAVGKQTYADAGRYIALGELKGGIDPAGADEHWKTARTALDRIHKGFARCSPRPHTFFVGAAIEAKMAREIWALLTKGVLANAANLTDERQIASIARWLCRL